MSDDGLMNLEDDATPEPEAPAAPAAAPPTPETPPADEGPAEVEAVEVAGKKYVPLAAVISERKQRQELTAKAARVDELEAQWRSAQPYVEFLRNNPAFLQQRQPPEAPAPAAPAVDPDALEAAQLMDFYKADGTPDIEKGARWLNLQDKRSGRVADERVRPMVQDSLQERGQINFQRALQIKDANGETPSEEALRSIWAAMTPELVADQRVAGALAAMALGMDRMKTPRKQVVAPQPNAPLVSEASGGVPRLRPSMSAFEASVAKDRGIAPAKWEEHTKNFVPGRATTLED